jgi:hypothetical protein
MLILVVWATSSSKIMMLTTITMITIKVMATRSISQLTITQSNPQAKKDKH